MSWQRERQRDPEDAREICVTAGAIVASILVSCVCVAISALIVVACAHVFFASEP